MVELNQYKGVAIALKKVNEAKTEYVLRAGVKVDKDPIYQSMEVLIQQLKSRGNELQRILEKELND